MRITVAGNDISASVIKRGFRLSVGDDYRSDFCFCCEFNDTLPPLKPGSETLLYDDSSALLWGGICESVTVYHRSPSSASAIIRCRGYEQVLQRRAAKLVALSSTTEGEAAADVYNAYLSPYTEDGEGLLYNAANFDEGSFIDGIVFRGKSLAEIFDSLCERSGFRWWVDKNKYLYFKETIPVTESGLDIDTNCISEDILSLTIKKELSGYRNTQYVLGSTYSVQSEAKNTGQILSMKTLFGSGIYSSCYCNTALTDNASTLRTAEGLLRCYQTPPEYLIFKTRKSCLGLYQRVRFRGSLYGIPYYANYVIISIVSTYNGKELEHLVTAMRSDVTSIRPRPHWTVSAASLTRDKEKPVAVPEEEVEPLPEISI